MRIINVITTGGTIEKLYSEKSGAVENEENRIERYLRLLRLPDLSIRITCLMNKDSLEMTEADRQLIMEVVRTRLAELAPIVITHGTDTMIETGLFIKVNLPAISRPIILTGAMTPLGFETSDGLQNLTESLFAARVLPPGVFLVMHNQIFPIDCVVKDRERGRFVWKPLKQNEKANRAIV